MASNIDARRRRNQNHYSSESIVPTLDMLTTESSLSQPHGAVPVCFSCFEEGHESTSCPLSGVLCLCCGGKGHDTEDCPIYFVDLSIRGCLTAHIQERTEQAKRRLIPDKGRFPAESLETSSISTKSGSKSGSNKSAKRRSLYAVQCIVCGNMGHANCRASPLQHGVSHCPRCCHPGHTAAECVRYPLTLQLGCSKDAVDSMTSPRDMIEKKEQSQRLQKMKWQKHRESSAARAFAKDPWHPCHLLN
uniref:CCHC-type domain-containing protein n=1 Tax=Eimeria tenella TaxID=5802 RepID=H9B952_EIMTE|nr:hypothetical protein [Eimeria tenella]